jgi:hypothetical protein
MCRAAGAEIAQVHDVLEREEGNPERKREVVARRGHAGDERDEAAKEVEILEDAEKQQVRGDCDGDQRGAAGANEGACDEPVHQDRGREQRQEAKVERRVEQARYKDEIGRPQPRRPSQHSDVSQPGGRQEREEEHKRVEQHGSPDERL